MVMGIRRILSGIFFIGASFSLQAQAIVLKVEGSVNLGNTTAFTVSGRYAYVLHQPSNSLKVIDISNPKSPTLVATMTNGAGGALLYTPIDIVASGNYLYVISCGSDCLGTLEIIDVTIPAAPVHKGSLVNGAGGASL